MNTLTLPDNIDPLRLVDKHVHLEGVIELASLSRLAESLHAVQGDVSVSLDFLRDAQNIAHIRGCANAKLLLTCQRCLEGLFYLIESSLDLTPVRTEKQAERLPETCEPVVTGGKRISLHEMIENELLLNLPVVAMHNSDDCPVKLSDYQSEPDKSEDGKRHPFVQLHNIKKRQ